MARGITTAYQLQKTLEVQPSVAARLWRGEMAMIALATVERLCDKLECEPGDLIVREKAAPAKKKASRK